MKIMTSEQAGSTIEDIRAVTLWIDSQDNWRVGITSNNNVGETPIATINGNSARSRRLAANVADSGIGVDTIVVDGLSITEHVTKAVAAIV